MLPETRMDDLPKLFSQSDLSSIESAVREAEARTSGEIVPFVVEASDDYPTAAWKGAAFGAFLGPLIAAAIYYFGGFWATHAVLWIVLPAAAGGAAGYLLTAAVPPLRRWMAGDEVLERRSQVRAEAAFLEAEVFRTRERTCILLFLSLFEHRVIVLGDTGIHQKVQPGEWDGIVQTIVAGIRSGRPAAALVSAIGECGALLERHGVARRADDRNELTDELRRGKE
jgi:putative membrane protein